MTKERVESIRKIVLPFIAKKLKEIDYEGLGESDAKEFTNDFNEILKLAEDAIEQDCISRQAVKDLMRSLTRWYVRSEDGRFNNVGLLYDDVMFGIDRLPSGSSSEKPRLIDPAYEKTLNKWIGAEVLDRIRNEMHATAEKHEDGVYYLRDEWVDEIIDKYAEGSDKE